MWVAQKALSAAKAIVGAAGDVDVNLDPEVLAWEADNAALQVAGDSAMAGLKAAKFVADGVLNLASFILDDIVKNVRLYIILNGLLGQYTSKTYDLVLIYMVYLEGATHRFSS